jgi:hypothetical protein
VYYWILITDSEGHKKLVYPPGETEEEANRMGYQKLDEQFQIIPLATRDKTEATRAIRGMILQQTGKVDSDKFNHIDSNIGTSNGL